MLDCTLQCRLCAVCPSVLLLLTVEVRLTRSSSGMMWSLTGGGSVFLLSTEKRKFILATERTDFDLLTSGWYRDVSNTFIYILGFQNVFGLSQLGRKGDIYCSSGGLFILQE